MLQNLPVRTKLIAILVLPVLVMTLLVVSRIAANVAESRRADRLTDLTQATARSLALVHELQKERDLSAGVVGETRVVDPRLVTAQRSVVDQSRRTFDAAVDRLDPEVIRPQLRQQLTVAGRRLVTDLGAERTAVDRASASGGRSQSKSPTGTIDSYTKSIENLLSFVAGVPTEPDAAAFSRDLNAVAALARAKEATALERSQVIGVLASRPSQPARVGLAAQIAQPDQAGQAAGTAQDAGEVERLVSVIGAGRVWQSQFESLASDSQREQFHRTMSSPDAGRAQGVRRDILNEQGKLASDTDPRQWLSAMNGIVDRFRSVEQSVGSQLLQAIAESKAARTQRALTTSLLIVVILAFSVGISLAMSQSMVNALAKLRGSALDIAQRRLPSVVERLRHLDEADQISVRPDPAQSVRSSDEIGEVANAFSAVYQVAVRVATEQAALRKSVGDMFLNFARRSQTLIDRQLQLIHELRRKQADVRKVEEFSRLDHLATRMRRNAEDLIVLSGAKPARRWSEPIPLVDVVEIALAEVEDYKRVEVLKVDDLGIAGHAASDVAHVLAELIENATSFSPPQSPVHIAGQTVTNGYVIEIEDQGIGMSDAELVEANDRLANPTEVDLTVSSRLGLFVVGRLAERYGIRVQLRHSWYDGVAALVLLPDQLVTLPAEMPLPEPAGARAGGERPALAPPPPSLPASTPEPPAADTEPEPEPAPEFGQEEYGREEIRLPIFEATRSDWFEKSTPAPTGPNGSRRATGADAVAEELEAAREAGGPPPTPPAAPPPTTPLQQTSVGLPRRVPRVNMAPALAAGSSLEWDQDQPVAAGTGRSPDEVRRMLSSYRSGFERGRHEASSQQDERGRHEASPRSAQGDVSFEADSPVPRS
jgi:signal transduction histidine kinase